MLDSKSYAYSNQNINMNAVSGGILKNHPKSWFERFNLNGNRAKELLTEGGHMGGREYYDYSRNSTPYHDEDKDIIVLQMMICGDMEVVAECVYAKDYNAEFEREWMHGN